MIQPEDIQRKAKILYTRYLRAWLASDEDFFPRMIPGNKRPDRDLAAAIQSVRSLRAGSKEYLGYGYTVQWQEVNSRRYGRNLFPARILFESRDDLLRYVGKAREFRRFSAAVAEIRCRYPVLEEWVASNIGTLVAIESDLAGLLDVLDTLFRRPRPGCFVRELPIAEDSKFIERHKPLLRQWLDRVLPPHTIRADEDHFERRYGLRYAEPHLFVRFLDQSLRQQLGFPCETVSVPLHTIETWPDLKLNVLIVENKVNLLTVPSMGHTIGLGALGKAVSLLRYLPWLAESTIIYWGDMDVEGFGILSDLRGLFPKTCSVLMDEDALKACRHLAIRGTNQRPAAPPNLTGSENSAFDTCRDQNLRIEQERIPQKAVCEALSRFPESALIPALRQGEG